MQLGAVPRVPAPAPVVPAPVPAREAAHRAAPAEPGPLPGAADWRTGLVGSLAGEITRDRQRGELQPWQEVSSQHLLDLAHRLRAGEATQVSDRLLEAGLTYLVNAGRTDPLAG